MLDARQLTGRSDTHVTTVTELACRAHPLAAAAFLAMREAAAREGIDLAVASAFRDMAHQLAIWNRKWRGERKLFDREGRLLDHAALGEAQRVIAILTWSALPGASRHHWGSEFDVFDRAALPEGHVLQLLPDEYAADGIFGRMQGWLQAHAARFGFFWPYDMQRGGHMPEAWHLSYAPVAQQCLPLLTPAVLREALDEVELEGREQVLAQLETVHAGYIHAVGMPPALALAAADAASGGYPKG